MCDEIWDGTTERRTHVCQFHNVKNKQIEELEKSKVSFTVLKIVIAIIFSLGGAYWYNQDIVAKARFNESMEQQARSTAALELHVHTSNTILKYMSLDVRGMKLNLKKALKQQGMEYQEIPGYYGPHSHNK